jgi:hypothetical protein
MFLGGFAQSAQVIVFLSHAVATDEVGRSRAPHPCRIRARPSVDKVVDEVLSLPVQSIPLPALSRVHQLRTLAAIDLTVAGEPRRPEQIEDHRKNRLDAVALLAEAGLPGNLLRGGIEFFFPVTDKPPPHHCRRSGPPHASPSPPTSSG